MARRLPKELQPVEAAVRRKTKAGRPARRRASADQNGDGKRAEKAVKASGPNARRAGGAGESREGAARGKSRASPSKARTRKKRAPSSAGQSRRSGAGGGGGAESPSHDVGARPGWGDRFRALVWGFLLAGALGVVLSNSFGVWQTAGTPVLPQAAPGAWLVVDEVTPRYLGVEQDKVVVLRLRRQSGLKRLVGHVMAVDGTSLGGAPGAWEANGRALSAPGGLSPVLAPGQRWRARVPMDHVLVMTVEDDRALLQVTPVGDIVGVVLGSLGSW